jgi:hypothetical protein
MGGCFRCTRSSSRVNKNLNLTSEASFESLKLDEPYHNDDDESRNDERHMILP